MTVANSRLLNLTWASGSVAEMALQIHTDRERCMGSGNCAFHAPNTFDLDDEMKVIVVDPAGDPDDRIRLAVDGCPTLALSIEE
jgi:ferredoxin